MKKEKVFVVTLAAQGKTDFGITFLTENFLILLKALNRFRKCYYVFCTEIEGEAKEKVTNIINHEEIKKIKFKQGA